jgi:NAD(P)H-hydrate epimerase
MTIRPLTRDEVRSIDARAAADLGIPTLILMENAGRGAAEWLAARAPHAGCTVVICGSGNNGGDGGVVARHLDAQGVRVSIRWLAPVDRLSPDARVQHLILARAGFDQREIHTSSDIENLERELAGADWLVDGILGTGLARSVEGLPRIAIEMINRSNVPTLALDVPSGLDADLGVPLGVAVRARATVTFVAPKVGFSAPAAATYTGEVHVADIGVPRRLLAPFESSDRDG